MASTGLVQFTAWTANTNQGTLIKVPQANSGDLMNTKLDTAHKDVKQDVAIMNKK